MEIDPRRIEVLDPIVARILRRMTPTHRVRMTIESNRFMRRRLQAFLQRLHPDWTAAQVQSEIARRVIGGPR